MGEVKELPIIFSGPMVNAILKGPKTQTRRVIRIQPPMGCVYSINGAQSHALCHAEGPITDKTLWVPPGAKSKDHRIRCPFGQPGDRLWVRETWCPLDYPEHAQSHVLPKGAWVLGDTQRNGVAYRATSVNTNGEEDGESKRCREEMGYKWKPSIHMPRWACRLTLKVTQVRVERLQQISEQDALAEGIESHPMVDAALEPRENRLSVGQILFSQIWDSLNLKRGFGWDTNCWVWVVSFEIAIDEQKALEQIEDREREQHPGG